MGQNASRKPETDKRLDFLQGGGETGALMRAHDWSISPLGPPGSWPQSLRSVVGLLLQSRFPMFVAWGSELGLLYNDSYAEILGAKHPRALGIPFYDVWSEIRADVSPLVDAALAGEATYREDHPLVMNRRGYDEQTWFTFSYSPVRDESGKVAGMFCAVCETTRDILAERALRENEAQLRELNETLERRVGEALTERKVFADMVEGTDAIVQMVDLDYRWVAVNKAAADEFERVFGIRPKAGDSMLELLADKPEHQAAVKAVWSRALAGEEFTETLEFGDPGHYRHAYEMKFNTLRDRDGKRIGAYQFVYDVTEQLRDQERLRHAEQTLMQAQKLEAIGQLTGGIAHDFNNLLAVISGGVQVLQRHIDAGQPQRVLNGMHRAVERGTALTRHLLAFSRRRPVNPEAVDLATHIAGMREMLTRSLRGDVHVVMNFGADLWPVEVDAGELELALLNVCVNARDAMPEGGTIAITGENVPDFDDAGLRGDIVKFSIADTGIGMPPEVQARAFEPFFTTKDVGKGSGLGLAQVYGFAQQSGGRVTIHSAAGIGTTVTLLLPRCRPTAVSTAKSAERAHDVVSTLRDTGNRARVLLVEDDEDVAALTSEMLKTIGFEVIHVSSAAAALGAAANGRALDIVLSDIMMPGGMNGLELAYELKRRRPRMPIVLTTGYPEAAVGIDNKLFGLLLKPYGIDRLAETLGAYLKRDVANAARG